MFEFETNVWLLFKTNPKGKSVVKAALGRSKTNTISGSRAQLRLLLFILYTNALNKVEREAINTTATRPSRRPSNTCQNHTDPYSKSIAYHPSGRQEPAIIWMFACNP
jgi:hypothetical protein